MRKVAIVILVFLMSCVERFQPEYTSDVLAGQLVVEAVLSQSKPVHEIFLSKSLPVNSEESFVPEINAQVMILDEAGICYEFKQDFRDQFGVYKLDSTLISFQSGRSYQLMITRENGEVYQSDFQKVADKPDFSNLDIQLAKDEYVVNGKVAIGEVIRAFSTLKVKEKTRYYRFDYDGVYAFRVPYQGSDKCGLQGITTYTEIQEEEIVYCYKYDNKKPGLNVLSTEDLEINSMVRERLFDIESDNKFSFGYDMNIYSYSISQSYYDFLVQINEQLELGGSLFDSPPTQIKGNIQSGSDPAVDALGFFTIEAGSKREVFIDSLFFKEPIRNPLNDSKCQQDLNDPDVGEGILRTSPALFCCDCRLADGAIEEPEGFWPE